MKSRIGKIKKSNRCGLMRIVEYTNSKNIKVEFKTGSIVKARYYQFRTGTIKDPLFSDVYGVGFIGIGKYKAKINGHITVEYNTWNNMIRRCYDPYRINKQPTYKNATIYKEWLSFQNFAKWHKENHYELLDERTELDKDIIKRGNKHYCPEFCSFVPRSINMILIKCDKSRGKYPIGVHFDKNKNKYMSSLNINGKQKYLGQFSTSLKAFCAYKTAKEEQIKIMANKYKDVLDTRVFNSLINYQVEITD